MPCRPRSKLPAPMLLPPKPAGSTALADLNRAKSDAEHSELDWTRAQALYKDASDREIRI